MFRKILKFIALAIILIVITAAIIYWVFPASLADWAKQYERYKADLTLTTTTVGDQSWPYLYREATDTKQAIILLHGFSADKDNWPRFAQNLPSKYNIIVPDLPGFGEHTWNSDQQYGIPQQAERLAAFIAAVAPSASIHIVGNSMGGNLAAYYAANYPENVRTVALFNNSGVHAKNPSQLDIARKTGQNPLLVDSIADYDRVLDLVMQQQPWIPQPVQDVLAQEALDNRARNAAIFEQYGAQRRGWLEPQLSRIQQPVLVLWGRYDRVIDVSTIETMRPLLRNETVVIIEEAGHLPMIETPDVAARHYVEFLNANSSTD